MTESLEAGRTIDADVYEPWVPVLGQRVRVRLSAECPLADEPALSDDSGLIGHEPHVDGVTGRINGTDLTIQPGHRFMVAFDVPVLSQYPERRTVPLDASLYAAIELEPITV